MGKDRENPVLNAALGYFRRGWSIIPIPYRSKAARIRWMSYQKTRPTEDTIRRWFSDKPVNIAVILGEVSGGLVCRDFDKAETYQLWIKRYPDLAKLLPTVQTGRGYHVYFEADYSGIKHFSDGSGELRGGGGYCLLPPSIHPDGPEYQWINPLNGNIPTVDPQLAGLLDDVTENTEQTEKTEKTQAIEGEEKRVERIIQKTLPTEFGTRNRKIFEFARELKSLPEFEHADHVQLEGYFRTWHKLALPNIRTKDFAESWIDFLKSWEKIKYKVSESPIMQLLERLENMKTIETIQNRYPDNLKVQKLAMICHLLQSQAGVDAFFLPCRKAAEILEISAMQASRYFFLLQKDGFLKEIEKGGGGHNPRKASRYKYLGD